MVKLITISLFLIAGYFFSSNGQVTSEHKKLLNLAGTWTVEGMEDDYIEICEMFEGGYFLVCNSTAKKESGGLSKGVSIFGYKPEEKHFTYYHYGSGGGSRSQTGYIDEEGTLRFSGEQIINGKLIKNRVVMTKKGENYHFLEERSEDGINWKERASFMYIRVK